MGIRLRVMLVVSVAMARAAFAGQTYVIALPERTANVTAEEAEAYYLAIVEELQAKAGDSLVERKQLKLVLEERDLGAALGDAANQPYADAAKKLQAKEVLVPSLCKVGDDFLLGLRMVRIDDGSTRLCAIRRTRVAAKFKDQAAAQVKQLLAADAATQATVPDEEVLGLKAARQSCLDAKADKLFPALWQRTEHLREALKADADATGVVSYYVMLLRLTSRAANPPEGMAFIPGGYVTMSTSAGKRQLWVEPFFLDRCEVSVSRYGKFLKALQAGARNNASLQAFTPITEKSEGFTAPDLPATGITWNAAEAFARRQGAQLPTVLQWMRAACGDDDREFPCGDTAACTGANLKGDTAGKLLPADRPGDDKSPFDVLGLTGNVREWTGTWHAKDAYAKCAAEAPQEPAAGTMKLVKGGSFRTGGDKAARTAGASMLKCGEAFDDVGFRCAAPFFLTAADVEKQVTRD